MGVEIEKKFLLKGNAWRDLSEGVVCRQGYLNSARQRTVRVRRIGQKGYLTVKGLATGARRLEYEYEIPAADAESMLEKLCEQPLIEKNRYEVEVNGLLWQIDEFLGENRGLIVAEIELRSEDQPFIKPEWVGTEVTGDPRYFNSNLVARPFKSW